ncbi:MAG: 1-acyl-sn-glycerol-3-phosphate acyltransferase [Chitinophagaceae bacterium]|nr:1-acyl-sn-glycerol-3-phosphate acyltransferase [Chitinophagaceae bacterium]
MFYSLIKFIARFSLLFFFRRKIICGKSLRHLKGPAIIAANHPNSLMDAVVIGCCCTQKVYFTIRSDMFNNKLFKILLDKLNGIPIYRLSEEKDKLRENFRTIERCKEILKNNGIIIIFAEGQTLHDWNLKPIKSGISKIVRHAITDVNLKSKLAVVPVGLTYSDYNHPGKTIVIQTGDSLYPGLIDSQLSDGLWKQNLNTTLFKKLEPLVPCMRSEKKENIRAWQIVIKSLNRTTICSRIYKLHITGKKIEQSAATPALHTIARQYTVTGNKSFYKSLSLFGLAVVPGITGLLLNGLYYFPLSRWVYHKTKKSIFYDALLCGLITITYPAYILLTAILLHFTTPVHFLFWLPIFPFTGWCTAYAYTLFAEVKNYLCIPVSEKKFLQDLII